jgi:putative ABC transport system permease protein
MGSDIKLAFRGIRKQPGFSIVVALTLTLGIGINSAVFGMIDAMLFRPFQFPDTGGIVVF